MGGGEMMLRQHDRTPAYPAGRELFSGLRLRSLLLLLAALIFFLPPAVTGQEFRTIDPSGQWKGRHGVLSLMLAGDALTFSYSAVFGATAHLCDGVGVAGLVKNGEYHNVDEQGTVAILVDENGVRMRTVDGIASFCGANWPGDDFTRDGYESATLCTVSVPKAYFHVAMRTPPDRRKGFVLKDDRVETVYTCFEGGDDWVFARFRGSKITTVGMLRKDALECSP
jgi:hypothetical protein